MTDSISDSGRRPVVLGPGEGRAYPMGRISAVFKADGAETGHAVFDLGVVARPAHQGARRRTRIRRTMCSMSSPAR